MPPFTPSFYSHVFASSLAVWLVFCSCAASHAAAGCRLGSALARFSPSSSLSVSFFPQRLLLVRASAMETSPRFWQRPDSASRFHDLNAKAAAVSVVCFQPVPTFRDGRLWHPKHLCFVLLFFSLVPDWTRCLRHCACAAFPLSPHPPRCTRSRPSPFTAYSPPSCPTFHLLYTAGMRAITYPPPPLPIGGVVRWW